MHGAVLAAALVGIALGTGLFTLGIAEVDSYLGDAPEACVNCHVMRDVYEGYLRGSHREVAVCNDCHAPHALVPKYATKAWNGLRHSFYFTIDSFHEPIRITPLNRSITEAQCRTCHDSLTADLDAVAGHREEISCTRCHADAGHL